MRIFFDELTAHVRMDGVQRTFPPEALSVQTDGSTLTIRDVIEEFDVVGPLAFDQIHDRIGQGFANFADAADYLDLQISRTGLPIRFNGPFTTHVVSTMIKPIGLVWKGTFDTVAGDLSASLPSDLPQSSELTFSNTGGGVLTIEPAVGQTISADVDGLRLHGNGIVIIRNAGTDWQLIAAASEAISSSANIAPTNNLGVNPGEHYFGTSGHWWNDTTTSVTVPSPETNSAMNAAGLTELNGVI